MRQIFWMALVGCTPVEEGPDGSVPTGSWVLEETEGSCVRLALAPGGEASVESASTFAGGGRRVTERVETFGTWVEAGVVTFEPVDIARGGIQPRLELDCEAVAGQLQCDDGGSRRLSFTAAEALVTVEGWRVIERDDGAGPVAWPITFPIDDEGRTFDLVTADGLVLRDDGTALRVLTESIEAADHSVAKVDAIEGAWTDGGSGSTVDFDNDVYDLSCEEMGGELRCVDSFGTSTWEAAALSGADLGVGPLCPGAAG